jgi:hypothetical protein
MAAARLASQVKPGSGFEECGGDGTESERGQ